MVQEAYVHGVPTRKVDDLVKALGMDGISKSRVSELCGELDEQVKRLRNRPLEGSHPCVPTAPPMSRPGRRTAA
jgi:transposase-like protein